MSQTITPENAPYRAYLPNTPGDVAHMLKVIGVDSIEALYADVPPDKLGPHLDLPAPMAEPELRVYMGRLASRNVVGLPFFLGYGAYRHFIPAITSRIIGRDEYETAYTPYQPEVAQATLQTTYDFQGLMCELMGMDVSNTGMLDEATGLAEAALMAARITERNKIIALDTIHPHSLAVVRNYAKGKLTVDVRSTFQGLSLDQTTAAVLVQQPNYLGSLEEVEELTDLAHKNGSLMVVSVDNPTSLGVIESPGNQGADIVVGNGQGLGLPVNLGGSNVGIFTAKQNYVRQMPGRIVGRTNDVDGKPAYVLTLQTREQHIRRENATSNICTAEALMALATTIYLASWGPGFEDLAQVNAQLAHEAADRIGEIPGYRVHNERPFFNEVVIECPRPPSEINQRLFDQDRIIGGVDVSNRASNGLLLCVTEVNTREQINQLVEALVKAA